MQLRLKLQKERAEHRIEGGSGAPQPDASKAGERARRGKVGAETQLKRGEATQSGGCACACACVCVCARISFDLIRSVRDSVSVLFIIHFPFLIFPFLYFLSLPFLSLSFLFLSPFLHLLQDMDEKLREREDAYIALLRENEKIVQVRENVFFCFRLPM
jgi:hypothetical protein